MATQKPISTISYNTEPFLREKLEELLQGHIIQAYQYICHKGEDGDKDHIHLRIEPNRRLDPMDLADLFREWPQGASKPLGCRPFRPSKEEDWILYAVHEPAYLKLKYGGAEKGEKLPYDWQEIRVPEYYDLEVAWIRAKASMQHSTVNLARSVQSGVNPMDLILQGENPYVVNALLHAAAGSDYQRVASELVECQRQLEMLYAAIDRKGLLVLMDDDGNFVLEDG